MIRRQKNLLFIIAIIFVFISSGYVIYKNQFNGDFNRTNVSDSSEIEAAQAVGDVFIADLQKGDWGSASKLATVGFRQNPSPYVENSSLQRFQSDKKATSSDWDIVQAHGSQTATARYTTYISLKGGQEAHYNMTLEKVGGKWLVSKFE